MVSERFPISYHASPRIHFKLLQYADEIVQLEDVQFEDVVMVECMSKMRLLRNLTWQKLWSNCFKTNEEVVDKLKMKRVKVPIDPLAAQPVQNRGVQAATNHEPLYLRFKRMKPKKFNGSTDPLVAQGWLKSIENRAEQRHKSDDMGRLCPRI
ncbi:hypothetical protein TIFTF001_049846 [Ficus carica]|uniref:Uncharacterized protein n=1 Tax=Ficus carica TaxID=3494 RepID=A0AA87YPX5_FICCA|nr:hypothetical protein TIFTF001_049846 [Ficus carica]